MSSDQPTPPDATAADLPEIALRILDAAVELFARKGYAATSVREIVQEAQVTNPMLYYYFDSKEGLFTFLTELLHREFRREIGEVVAAGRSLEETLVSVTDVHLRGLRESPRVLELVFNLLFGPEGSSPPHRLLENQEKIFGELCGVFSRAIDSGRFDSPFDAPWLVHQLVGIVTFHTMRGVKELQRCVSADERAAWIRENAGTDTAKQLVRFFLDGAGRVKE